MFSQTTVPGTVGRIAQLRVLSTTSNDLIDKETWDVRSGHITVNGETIPASSIQLRSLDGGECQPDNPKADLVDGFYWCDFYYEGLKGAADYCLDGTGEDDIQFHSLEIGIYDSPLNPTWNFAFTETDISSNIAGIEGQLTNRRSFMEEGIADSSGNSRSASIFLTYDEFDVSCDEYFGNIEQDVAECSGYLRSDENECGVTEDELKTLLSEAISAVNGCADNMMYTGILLGDIEGFMGLLEVLKFTADDAVHATNSFEDVFARSFFLANKIPKFGPVFKKLRTMFVKISSKLSFMVEKLPSSESINEKRLKLKIMISKLSRKRATVVLSRLDLELKQSNLDDVSQIAFDDWSCADYRLLYSARVGYETCELVFYPTATAGSAIDILPNMADVIRKIEELTGIISTATAWMSDLLGEFTAGATYAMCCDNFLRAVSDIVTFAVNAFNLLTCWVDGILEELVGEFIDLLFGYLDEFFTETLPGIYDSIKDWLVEMSLIDVEVPEIVDGEDFSTVCTQFTGETIEPFETADSDDGDVSWSSLGSAMLEACTDAIVEIQGEEEFDCCDVARTCDVADRIILYEGNDCTQNIAGTLSLPDKGQSISTKAGDQLCTANDEARSVQLIGPMTKGLRIEISDNENSLCEDDYAVSNTKSENESGSEMFPADSPPHRFPPMSPSSFLHRQSSLHKTSKTKKSFVSAPLKLEVPLCTRHHFQNILFTVSTKMVLMASHLSIEWLMGIIRLGTISAKSDCIKEIVVLRP